MIIPTLSTARLILRPPVVTDAPLIARYLNDIEVSGNLARVPFPYFLSDAEAWIRTRRRDMAVEEANFAIEAKGQGYVGHVGFHPGPQGPVLGYWLGKPFWGQGIMTEAAGATIDWFFAACGAPVIYSGVFHFNQASLAIQHKLGFTETGRSSLLCLARGVEVAHIDTKLARDAWKAKT
jgi:RimJ/RimL family protein N-acetyltransferase